MHCLKFAIILPFAGAASARPASTESASASAPACTQAKDTRPNAPKSPAQSDSPVDNLGLITNLEKAPTAVDRIALLNTSSDWKFDFSAPPGGIIAGKGGRTVRSDRKTFPALVNTGVSMTVGFIGPCGFNTPHTHPRSSEINIVVEGRLSVNFIQENGSPLITNTLEKYQMTVFPQGALHTEFNPDCAPAVFVAGFADEDPGVQQSVQTLFGVQEAVLGADLGLQSTGTINGQSFKAFKNQLPANVALGIESCLNKCGVVNT